MRSAPRSDRSFLPATERLPELTVPEATLERLRAGTLEVVGRLVDASNATFVCRLVDVPAPEAESGPSEESDVQVVYKPTRGERPLDDFPRNTLSRREVAAFALSEATGWGVVPPTVWRDGPLGPGMAQLWIDQDEDVDVLQMILARDDRMRQICVFDILANNADRKGGHLLPTADGHVYGVDHGICFATAPKLRTVLWGWRNEELLPHELDVVRDVCDGLDGPLREALGEFIDPREIDATQRRAAALAASGRFPEPDPTRPALPWPPF
ncbi:MAG: SCO1664 family protein [Candidatus Limnocylindrales bacterium]